MTTKEQLWRLFVRKKWCGEPYVTCPHDKVEWVYPYCEGCDSQDK